MLNNLFRKGLTFSVIFFFVGAGIAPITNGNNGITRGIKAGDFILNNISSEFDVPQLITSINNGSLSGYVTDTLMNPVEGARVRVSFHETYVENYSDSSGYYHVTNIPICWCLKNATASKEGYKSESILLSIDEKTTYNFVLTPSGNTLYVGGTGEGNYTMIQDAIRNASDGDTVYVYIGTYFEDVKINTSIVLQGEDKESTIIHGGGFGSGDGVILVKYTDNVEITGFSVRNSCPFFPGSGIGLYSTKQCIVTDNIAYNCCIGIHTYTTSDITISNNTVTNNEFGIRIQNSKRNLITRNNITDNNCGMELNGVKFNEIIPKMYFV